MPRAVRFDHYGDVDVLYVAEVPRPVLSDGEVLVEVVTAGINPGEIAVREGRMHERWPATFPAGQGSDFAGRVVEIGVGVAAVRPGQEVIGFTNERAAQADYVVVPAEQLIAKPPRVDWDQAGALFIAGVTGWAAVRAVGLGRGDTLAVSAAAGGVGSIVVQLARRIGAAVVGIAGPAIPRMVDERERAVGSVRRRAGRQAAGSCPNRHRRAFIDTFGGDYVALAVALGVRPERIDTIIDFAAAGQYGTKTDGSAAGASAEVLAELADLIASDQLSIPIAATYPLEQVRDAYTRLAERHTHGKIVLRLRED